MDRDRFDRLTRALAGPATRRRFGGLLLTLGIGAGAGLDLLGVAETGARKKRRKTCRAARKRCGRKCILKTQCCTAANCGPGGSCQGGSCLCPAGKQPCRGTCIADTSCCTDAECGVGKLCARGVCVVGQGTCPSQADSCTTSVVCNANQVPNCACFRTTTGAIRCGASQILGVANNCDNDADCAQLFPQTPGAFCTQSSGNCPGQRFCQAPCAA